MTTRDKAIVVVCMLSAERGSALNLVYACGSAKIDHVYQKVLSTQNVHQGSHTKPMYLCSDTAIFQVWEGATVGRRHTDDHDTFVSREHVTILSVDDDHLVLQVLSINGIAVWSSTDGSWTYYPRDSQCIAFKGDTLSLHVVRRSPCRVDSLTAANMHFPSCFHIATEDDLVAEVSDSDIEDLFS